MNKVKQILATLVLATAPFLTAGVVAADSCGVGFTGPNSDNVCTKTETYECSVNEDNTVTVDNGNTQISVTGDANDNDNTEGGGSLSGSATNSNGTTFDITVTNRNVCTLVTSVPATPTPTPTPTKVTPTATAQPAVLADTASDTAPQILAMFGAAAVVIAAGSLVVTRLIKR